jgi:SAM-dependent methyltransferase
VALLSEVLGGRLRTLEALSTDPWLAERAVFEPGITGPFRPYFSRAGRYVTSTYWEGGRSGETRDGRVCQNLSAMSFPDAEFDLVVTSDIMEHVRRPREAWAEIRRVLKPGGWHVFSIPVFHPLRPRSVARVDTSGAEDRHLLPPEYHGDGSSGLSLVYTDFGADLLDELASLGLPTKAVVHPGSDQLGRSVVSFVSVAA